MKSETPFQLTRGPQPLILVPAQVNGDGPLPFVLDTGAGHCLVTPELAARINLQTTASQNAAGAGGQVAVRLGTLDSMSVGNAEARHIPVAITSEIQRIESAVAAEIHGGVGYSFLWHFRITLDYMREVVGFVGQHDRQGDAPPQSVPFTLAQPERPLPLVSAGINGSGPFRLAVDTGSSTTVLSPGAAASLGIALREGKPMTGGGGQVQTSVGAVDSLRIGSAEVNDLTVRVADFVDTLSRLTGVRLDGIVGYNFLRRFRVTLDYPDSWLMLEPAS